MSSRTLSATPAMTGARRRLKLLLFIVVLFMSWALYVLIVQYGQISDRSGQLHEADRKLTDAQAKNEELKQQIARLNDPEYIGQIARKEHGLGLPGEVPIETE
ncbi:FtsB family cell division protein [Cohnella luojiensis]|uniref:Septum formation initiator family protein n=1 Tax=Cohnella luojiensis TaxID=652876 RepID=A0A4Y8LRP0_9BACL|nr:septum formation initiator family protein [Cohnella luojiensis]TFE24118.1 septum formation initiator family protein [Cohnella luojiensis]